MMPQWFDPYIWASDVVTTPSKLPLDSCATWQRKLSFTKMRLFLSDSQISLTSNYGYIEGFGDMK